MKFKRVVVGVLMGAMLVGSAGSVFAAGEQINTLPETFPTTDTTYYGRWVALESVLEFFFDGGNGGVGGIDGKTTSVGVTDGSVPAADQVLPTTTKPGYAFMGWYKDVGFTTPVVSLPTSYPANGQKYYVKWEANTSVINLHVDGGTTITTFTGESNRITGKTDDAIAVGNRTFPATTKAGYTFGKWWDEPTFVTERTEFPDKFPVGGANYYVKWIADPSFVRLDPDDGAAVVSIDGVTDGNVVGSFDDPVRTGYTFGGWYTEKNGAGAKINALPATFPVGGVTYYAKWTIDQHDVTFDYNGNGTASTSSAYNFGSLVTKPTDPSRPGYTFDAWYDSNDVLWDFATNTVGTSDMTLKAKWVADVATIKFVTNGDAMAPLIGVTDGPVLGTLGTPTRTGYTFSNWTVDRAVSTTELPATYLPGTITYTANWTINGYAVTFVSGAGASVVTGQTINFNDLAIMPSAPSRNGYTFVEWCTESPTGPSFSFDTPITGAITLYAKWGADTASILFDLDGGTVPSSIDMVGNTDVEINPTTMPDAPTKPGYIFDGWWTAVNGGGTEVTSLPNKYPVGSLTYHAKWIADDASVKFVVPSGASQPAQRSGKTNEVIAPALAGTTSTKQGYLFGGWFDGVDGTGNQTVDGDFPTKYPAGILTYHAKFTPKEITLSFISGDPLQEFSDIKALADSTGHSTAMPVVVARAGYTFDGWWTTAE